MNTENWWNKKDFCETQMSVPSSLAEITSSAEYDAVLIGLSK